MTSPASALHDAVFRALSTAPAVTPWVGNRIYDRPPQPANYPYIAMGFNQVIEDGDSCDDGWECFSDVHVWTQDQGPNRGKAYAQDIGGAVTGVLSLILPIEGFRIVSAKLETENYFDDVADKVAHGVLTFRYLIDPPA